MPLYTYQCNQCGFTDEAMVPVKKRNKKFPCDQEGCTGVMERDIDVSAFRLKGGGWAKDGYSKKQQKKKQDD